MGAANPQAKRRRPALAYALSSASSGNQPCRGQMRITELFRSFGAGGAEIAAANRLRYQPVGTHTSFVVSKGPGEVLDAAAAAHSAEFVTCGTTLREQLNAIAQTEPDVVVVNTPRQACQLLLGGGRHLRWPVVVAAHSETLSDRLSYSQALSLPMRLANGRAELNVAVSERVATGPWCRGAKRIRVCHLGSEVRQGASREEISWPPGCSLRLLVLSRLTRPKNLSALIQAVQMDAEHFRAATAHVRVVGDGPQKGHLMHEASRLGVSDLVSFQGGSRSPGAWMSSADWLVIASVAEGGPLTVYEGLQAGLRVMATPVGVIPEVLAEDSESILLREASVSALRAGLQRILSRPSSITQSARAARSAAATRWNTSVLAPEWFKAIESVR